MDEVERSRIDHLRYAISKSDRLKKELAETDAYIAAEGRLYWKARGYSVMPRIEKLRAEILGTVGA